MEFKEGTHVYTGDEEEIGKVNRFVINPVTKKVTHIVVQKGLVFPEDKVVPVEWVSSADDERVKLSIDSSIVQDLPPFEEMHYVNLDEAESKRLAFAPYEYVPLYYWYPPYGSTGFARAGYAPEVTLNTERNIPENTVPIKEGADVISADGNHVGDVERVFADSETSRATHFLISQGVLLKDKKLVPVDWISMLEEDKVHLAVGEQIVDRLPDYHA